MDVIGVGLELLSDTFNIVDWDIFCILILDR